MHAFRLVGGILILILVKKLFDKRNATTAKGKTEDAATSSSATQGEDSSSSSFPSSSGWDYEVFLSFRGEDTRTNFTDHLYNALVETGIHTFRDNEGLRIGEKIDHALRSAIHQSKIAIPIFSKNYASSKWCLRELAEIVECMKQEGQRQITVMPVFYHVDPSEVRHQIGCYKNAFQSHQKKFSEETEGWKKALKEVADLKGWDLKNIANGHEAKLVQLIVKKVLSELRKSPLFVSDNLVGIHSHVEEMKKLLNIGSQDIQIVGIHGLGGIGKTTIARCVYNTIYHHFDGSSFLADTRETFQTKGLIHLQCQLVINILKKKNPNFISVDQGIDMIKQIFSNKKVLIVVDDVDQNTDLSGIIGKRDWFGVGSRIIITTRDTSVLNRLGVDGRYEPNEMDSDDSLLLFSKHAFKRDQPPEQYLDLSKDVIKTAGGLPLALEVLGSSLVGKGESAWKDTVKKLKKIPNDKVLGKLRISYDGLDCAEKEMFRDIACFFIGMNKDIACYICDGCGFFPEAGIEVLCQKSLVKIGENDELRMHDQLRDLGREIVYQENPKKPEKRSRLWLQQEVLDILNTQKGTDKVEGLCIDFEVRRDCLMSEGFASMTNLRLLQLDYARVAGNFVHSFSELRWLSWKECPMQFTPTNLRKLVVLDLSKSEITENWMGWNYIKEAVTLKVLNLSSCDKLSRSPNFSANQNLERLILERCGNLVTVDQSIGHLERLVFLDVSFCSSLRYLPATVSALPLLQTLFVKGCDCLQSLPGLPSSLKSLNASYTGLKSLPKLSHLINLEVLHLRCRNLAEIPITINTLTRLKSLCLGGCYHLTHIPVLPSGLTDLDVDECKNLIGIDSLEGLDSLDKLKMDNCGCLRKLPKLLCLKKLTNLELTRIGISEIEGLEGLFSLDKLIINKCHSLRKIPNLSDLKNLVTIDISSCNELSEIEGFQGMFFLEKLIIKECGKLSEIGGLKGLYSLQQLIIKDCHSLRKIPNLSDLENLVTLDISSCNELSEIEGFEGLDSLEKLIIKECPTLSEIGGLKGSSSLQQLIIKDCRSLRKIPTLSGLKYLVWIYITSCNKLSEIEGLEGLDSLERLDISFCDSLTTIPDLSYSKSLRSMEIEFCPTLSKIEGLKGLDSLEILTIESCNSLRKIPNFSDSKNLVSIKFRYCHQLSEIEGLEGLDSSEKLRLHISRSDSLTKINLPRKLSDIHICGCEKLSEIECSEGLEALKKFRLSDFKSIVRLPDLSNLKTLKRLEFCELKMVTEIGKLEGLESLEKLMIEGAPSLKVLPDVSTLKNLKDVELKGLKKLTEMPSFEKLESLEVLEIEWCESLERLPDLSNLTRLMKLRIEYCAKLTEIQGVDSDKLESLEVLEIRCCNSLERLPDLSNLTRLMKLRIEYCAKLTEIQGVDRLEILEELSIKGSDSIETLPCLSNLKKLRELSAVNCKKLTEIQGVDTLESLKVLDVRGCISMKLQAFGVLNSN